MNYGYVILDNNSEISLWNKGAEKMFGYKKEEILGTKIHKFIALPGSDDEVKHPLNIIFESNQDKLIGITQEKKIRKKDGEYIIIELSKSSIPVEGKWHIIATIRDITQKMNIEKELIENEEKFRNFVETSQDLIWMCDKKGLFIYLNPKWEETLGYKIDEMLGRPFRDFKDKNYVERDLKEFTKNLVGGKTSGYQTQYIHKLGHEVILLFNAIPFHNEKGEIIGTQGSAHDITDKIKMENEIIKDSKLESLGILAGGFAHDFNNLLQGIQGYNLLA